VKDALISTVGARKSETISIRVCRYLCLTLALVIGPGDLVASEVVQDPPSSAFDPSWDIEPVRSRDPNVAKAQSDADHWYQARNFSKSVASLRLAIRKVSKTDEPGVLADLEARLVYRMQLNGHNGQLVDIAREAFDIRTKLYGPYSKQACYSAVLLAYELQWSAHLAAAEQLLRQALSCFDNEARPDPMRAYVTALELSWVLGYEGKYSEGLPYAMRGVKFIRVQPPETPDIATEVQGVVSSVAALALRWEGSPSEDLDQIAVALKEAVAMEALNSDGRDPTRGALLNDLSRVEGKIGDWYAAESFARRGWDINRNLTWAEPTIRSGHLLALALSSQRRLAESERALSKTVDLAREQAAGSLEGAEAMSELAMLRERTGYSAGALQLLEQSIPILRKEASDDLTTGVAIETLASVQADQGRVREATRTAEDSVCREVSRFGPQSYRAALALNTMGYVLRATGSYKEAASWYKRSYELLKRHFHLEHPWDYALGIAAKGLGDALRGEHEETASLPYYREALPLLMGYGDYALATADTYHALSDITFSIDRSQSLDYAERAFETYRELPHPLPRGVLLSLKLANLLAERGETTRALEVLNAGGPESSGLEAPLVYVLHEEVTRLAIYQIQNNLQETDRLTIDLRKRCGRGSTQEARNECDFIDNLESPAKSVVDTP
jgi:tetratricopeptide (TPR) repeat protein